MMSVDVKDWEAKDSAVADRPGVSPLAAFGQIPADHYWRKDVLSAEIERVFSPSWLCVGFTQDLKNDRDFITAQIGPHSVVVQNFKGELKAFRNVCSHRFSRIQTASCGNRPLTCPYHGWTYNADGVPFGVPQNAKAFGLSDAEKESLALQAYPLETVGHFVFVRMSQTGPSLRLFLGEVYEHLAHVAGVCSHRVENLQVEVDANWKLGIENGIEAYHHAMVHADTFSSVLQQDIAMNAYGPHCTHEGALTDKSRQWWSVVADKAKLKTSDRYRDYISFLIFPNIVTTFTAGAFFTFQVLMPSSPSTLRIASSGWLAQGAGAAYAPVVASLAAFSEKVRAEDQAICAVAQAGVAERGIDRAALLGEVDNRVRHFQRAYAASMQEGGDA